MKPAHAAFKENTNVEQSLALALSLLHKLYICAGRINHTLNFFPCAHISISGSEFFTILDLLFVNRSAIEEQREKPSAVEALSSSS